MLRMNPISGLVVSLMIVIAMADESIAEEDFASKRKTASEVLSLSPNAAGVWEADAYGTLRHLPSGFTCLPGSDDETLKLVQLTTSGDPIGNEASCRWNMVREHGELSVTLVRSEEGALRDELTRNIEYLKTKHAATDDGLPMSMGGKPPFEFEASKLRFMDDQNRQMSASIWVYSADGWLLTTKAKYEHESSFSELLGAKCMHLAE